MDFFAVFVLLVVILMLIYLVAASVYFWRVMHAQPITSTEATVLFWSTVVAGILLLIVGIWAVVRMFSYSPAPAHPQMVTLVMPQTSMPTATPMPAAVTPTVAHVPIQVVATGT
jgi:hypothetical protein